MSVKQVTISLAFCPKIKLIISGRELNVYFIYLKKIFTLYSTCCSTMTCFVPQVCCFILYCHSIANVANRWRVKKAAYVVFSSFTWLIDWLTFEICDIWYQKPIVCNVRWVCEDFIHAVCTMLNRHKKLH